MLMKFLNRVNASNSSYVFSRLGLSYQVQRKISDLAFTKFPGDDTKPPIVILHGLLGNRNNWRSLAKTIAKSVADKSVYLVDARNHGESPHLPEMNYVAMSEDLVSWLDALHIPSALLMGHSMGGRTAMAAALNHPERIASLVVLDISPYGTSESIGTLPRFVAMLRRLRLPNTLSLQQARKHADQALLSVVPEVGIRQFLLTNLYKSEDGSFGWRANLGAIEECFNPHISTFPLERCGASYGGPAHFVGGANSNYIARSEHSAIAGLFPLASFQYLPGAGHWLHADKPHQFLEMVRPMLAS